MTLVPLCEVVRLKQHDLCDENKDGQCHAQEGWPEAAAAAHFSYILAKSKSVVLAESLPWASAPRNSTFASSRPPSGCEAGDGDRS